MTMLGEPVPYPTREELEEVCTCRDAVQHEYDPCPFCLADLEEQRIAFLESERPEVTP